MRLSRDEEQFLRHWMYDEVHYQEGQGAAKQLQLQHGAMPAELATLIAAGIPDLAEQEAAGREPPTAAPNWPWPDESYRVRLAEARQALAAPAGSEGECGRQTGRRGQLR